MPDIDLSQQPVDREAREEEARRPAVVVLGPQLFLPHTSILRYRTGAPQRAFAQVRSMLKAERFERGAVTVVGHTAKGVKYYRDALGRRRAEAVKAAICGDKERCDQIMRRLYKVETLDRVHHRWMNREADELLELVHPEVSTEWGQRIVHFQKEAGLLGDGLCAKVTWEELLEAYASYASTSEWSVRNRVYSAMGEWGDEPGTVELWVWPETPPPEGTLRTWRARAPIVIYQDVEGESAEAAEAQAAAEAVAESQAAAAASAAASAAPSETSA